MSRKRNKHHPAKNQDLGEKQAQDLGEQDELTEEEEPQLPVLNDMVMRGEDAASPQAWRELASAQAAEESRKIEVLLRDHEGEMREQVEAELRERLSGALDKAVTESTRSIMGSMMAELPGKLREKDRE